MLEDCEPVKEGTPLKNKITKKNVGPHSTAKKKGCLGQCYESHHPLIFPRPMIRLILLATVGIAIIQQISGVEIIMLYGPFILLQSGYTSQTEIFGSMLIVAGVRCIFIILASFFVDKFGRRPLLLLSINGMGCALLGIAIVEYYQKYIKFELYLMCIFMGFFSIGIGPLTWLSISELSPTVLRSRIMGVSMTVNRIMAACCSLSTYSFINAIGGFKYFLMLSCFAFLGGIYLYIFYPESKGMTIEEISADFEKRASKLKNLSVCTKDGFLTLFHQNNNRQEINNNQPNNRTKLLDNDLLCDNRTENNFTEDEENHQNETRESSNFLDYDSTEYQNPSLTIEMSLKSDGSKL